MTSWLGWDSRGESIYFDEGGQLASFDRDGAQPTSRLVLGDQVGQNGKDQPKGLMVHGDALPALRAIAGHQGPLATPAKLIYLDPPFNTGERSFQFSDGLRTAEWLSMMWDRLVLARSLLAEDGSMWIHCDDRGQAHLRLLLDEIFGTNAFLATIVWQRRYSRENRRAIGPVHDYIHVYAPLGSDWKQVRNRLDRSDQLDHWTNPDDDPRGPWNSHSLVAQGGHGTKSQSFSITTPSGRVVTPPKGSCWRVTRERFNELLDAGRITFGAQGRNVPRKKVFAFEAKGLTPWTWWPHAEVGHNQEAKREATTMFPDRDPFSTPKPERLIRRIVEIATDPGELVLDFFLGSATTAAVAHKLRRNWIGVELREEILARYAVPRLERVVEGDDTGGISEAVAWTGGGSFRCATCVTQFPQESDGPIVVVDRAA